MLGGLITGAVVFALEAQVSSFVLFDLEILHIFRVFLYGERNESRWNAPTRLISFVFFLNHGNMQLHNMKPSGFSQFIAESLYWTSHYTPVWPDQNRRKLREFAQWYKRLRR